MFVNLRVGAVNRKSVVFVNFPPIVHPHMVRVDKSFTAGRPLSPPRYNVEGRQSGRVENCEPWQENAHVPPINYVSARPNPNQQLGCMVRFPDFLRR